jgi:starch-binding outer membrane protein, SusD/RagB family
MHRYNKPVRVAIRLLGVTALAAGFAACNTDKLVEVDQPDIIPPEALGTITALPANLAAAQADFQAAFGGTNAVEGQVNYSGLLGDELINTETFPTRIDIDRRQIQDDNSNSEAVYRSLARARQSAERTARLYKQLLPQRSTLADTNNFDNGRAEALALAGYTYIYFGENYCSPLPFTEVDSASQVIPSAALPADSTWRRALARFDTAAALAGAVVARGTPAAAVSQATNVLRLVRIGRARVYLNMADPGREAFLDSAVAAIGGTAGVPTTYTYRVFGSENSGRENNGVWSFAVGQLRWGVANKQGTNGLPYRDNYTNSQAATSPSVDNRTGFGPRATGFDGVSANFRPIKYPNRSAPITVADGVEARLIEAEVSLRKQGGIGAGTWLTTLNSLRSSASTLPQQQCVAGETTCANPPASGLPPLTAAATAKGNYDILFTERAYWLFLTAHRLGDMRREVRQLGTAGYAVNNVYPVGKYEKNVAVNYGTDVSFPIPITERANTAFAQSGPTCDNTIP